jgi:serine/threonine-protein kinase
VGKYRVVREIGRGGMAAVYEAEHLTLGKKVAIKVLAAELAASSIVIERFFREARAASSVKSANIVDIYDSGRLEDGRPFIAMEMLDGETLYDRMTRIRLIDPASTVRIISQCCKGLTKAHAVGIVHRDLKPENIFILKAEDGEELVKILDFGLAKFYAPVKADEKTARLTREGAVFGTPAYMSPEQVKGQGSVDHRADLWALGCMAFECLTGRPVWNTDQGVAMTFASIAAAALPVPSKFRPDLPPTFDEWFRKALERDPNKRFQTAKELAAALARAFGGGPVSVVAGPEREYIEADTLAMKGPPPGMAGRQDYDDEMPTIARNSSLASAPALRPPLPPPPLPQRMPTQAPLPPPPHQPRPAPPPREAAPSAVDLPPTATAAGVTQPVSRAPVARYVLSGVGLVGALTVLILSWAKVLGPQISVPIVKSTAVAAADSGAPGTDTPPATSDEPKWAVSIAEAQKAFFEGDGATAQRKLKDAQDQGAPGATARAISEQMAAGSAGTGPCKMAAFAHPRLGTSGNARLPSAAASGTKGAILSWVDSNKDSTPAHDHVFSVMIDGQGRPMSHPRDLTPELTTSDVTASSLLPSGTDRTLLLYGDKGAKEQSIRARWIDADGRIEADSVLVTTGRPGGSSPAIDRAPDGFFVAWTEERDGHGDELYLRHLGQKLEPLAGEVRATDFVDLSKGHPSVVRTPDVAISSNEVYVTFELDRDPKNHLIERLRVPLGAPELATGLEPAKPPPRGAKPKDRTLGDASLVNAASNAPAIACGSEGCFIAWNVEGGGAWVSLLSPKDGTVTWRRPLAAKGTHPVLAASSAGQIMAAYYEAGKVRLATISRDGIGPVSTVAKVSQDTGRPVLTSGRPGEWLIAWQDLEERHSEVYAARVVCK